MQQNIAVSVNGYFKEDTKDTIGDLIAPLPASLVVYFYRNYLNKQKQISKK